MQHTIRSTPSYMHMHIVLLSSCTGFAPQLPLTPTTITPAYSITASFTTAAYFATYRKPIASHLKPIASLSREYFGACLGACLGDWCSTLRDRKPGADSGTSSAESENPYSSYREAIIVMKQLMELLLYCRERNEVRNHM